MIEGNKIDAIFQTVYLSDNSEFKRLLKDLDINILNRRKQNLLQIAIANKNEKVALLVIAAGINLNSQDQNGQTALHYCGLYRSKAICEAIVTSGKVDVNIIDKYGNNPLWTAVYNASLISAKGDYSIVKILKDVGGNSNSINNAGKSPIGIAKEVNIPELIKILED